MRAPIDLPAREVARRLRAGEVSPLELIDAALARISAVDPLVNAVPTLCAERARRHARRIMTASAPAGPLAGMPVLIKDLVEVAVEEAAPDFASAGEVFTTLRAAQHAAGMEPIVPP